MDDIIFFILLGISLVIFIVCVIIYLKGMNSIYLDLNFLKDYETIKSLEEKLENRLFDKNIKVEKVNAEEQIEELEKELAEKEKEIETLKKCGDTDHFYGLFEDKRREIDICRKYIEKQDQDKISFAVEQLEKVKEFVVRQLMITTKDCNDLDEAEAKGCNELRAEAIKEIDNQIKQLKEKL